MTGDRPEVGQVVTFGRRNGERTRGEIVKVNRTRCKVRQIDARGVYRDHRPGQIWTVPFSLIYSDDGAPMAPTRRETRRTRRPAEVG